MTTLYRLLGENQDLVYVGITDNYGKRIREHAEKSWFHEVRTISTAEYATRAEAKAAETYAIKSESPKYNKSENPTRSRRPHLPPRNIERERLLVTMEQAAGYAEVSIKTIRRRISDGTLRAYKLGPRMIRIDRADLDSLFRPVAAWEPR